MSRIDPTTLAEMMAADGMADVDQRLRWMVLTWDLAKINADEDKFFRAIISTDWYVSISGGRTNSAFATTATDVYPTLGRRTGFGQRSESALQNAVTATEVTVKDGFKMLCRPLSVNLERFDGEPLLTGFTALAKGASGRTEALDASDLVADLRAGGPTGREVLAEINRVRAAARATHLDPHWRQNFPGADELALWIEG